MSTEENKELVLKVFDFYNDRNMDVTKMRSIFDKYYAPGWVSHLGSRSFGRKQVIEMGVAEAKAFPDYSLSVDDMWAVGDKVITMYTWQATHKGTYMGIEATGKRLSTRGVQIDRIGGGKIVQTWGFFDMLDMMTQLGATFTAPKK